MLYKYGPVIGENRMEDLVFRLDLYDKGHLMLWSMEDDCLYYPFDLDPHKPIIRANDEKIEVIYKGKVIYSCDPGVENLYDLIINNNSYFIRPISTSDSYYDIILNFHLIYVKYKGDCLYIRNTSGYDGTYGELEFGVIKEGKKHILNPCCTLKDVSKFIYKNRCDVDCINRDMRFLWLDTIDGGHVFEVQ